MVTERITIERVVYRLAQILVVGGDGVVDGIGSVNIYYNINTRARVWEKGAAPIAPIAPF